MFYALAARHLNYSLHQSLRLKLLAVVTGQEIGGNVHILQVERKNLLAAKIDM